MPEINVEIKGSGYDANNISATLDSKKLTLDNVRKYDKTKDTTCVYILVDLSTSMYGSFNLVKKNISTYINEMSSNDKIVLITFGEKEVKTVLNGSEDRKTALKTVNELKCNENGTLFYEALSRAYQLSNTSNDSFSREYVIAFSDGIDVQKGNTTFDEVIKEYDSRSLPLYAACSSNTSKSAADKFGELSRASGGNISIISSEKVFKDFLAEINNVTIVELLADTNNANGKEQQLTINVGSSQIDYNVPIIRSISDEEAPAIKNASFDAKKEAFILSYSETVIGADKTTAYKIVDSKGKSVSISEVFYSESDNNYEIKTKDTIYKGKYTIEFSGITDISKEKNPVTEKQIVTVTESSGFKLSSWLLILIIVGSVLILAGIVLLIVIFSKKKANSTTEDDLEIPVNNVKDTYDYVQPPADEIKHHIRANDAIRIRLRITTGKSLEQNVETNIVSSLIVGRSDTCDIFIDDTKLSRQHFVIENDNGDFYICDLQSRNGTMLNGIRINSRQRINSGDKILAGLSDIVITILGR